MSQTYHPLLSLKEGNWFKLICGASFQHLPVVRSLTLAYTLAGADCIDVSADPAVIAAAKSGIEAARKLLPEAKNRDFLASSIPWLMVSLNDGEDPHFRKAEFNPNQCPTSCHRPCIQVCPTQAIQFSEITAKESFSGVIDQLCYGCGRCLPVCPSELIHARSYVSTPGSIAPLIQDLGIDAIEIHTQVGNLANFKRLWQAILPWCNHLKLLAISCQDAPGLIDYLQAIYQLISPLPCPLIWQTDGRPMSGDLGKGTTRATVKLAQKVLTANLPGYVQLAGGTNQHTVAKLQAAQLIKNTSKPDSNFVSGIAYGSYARSLLHPILEHLDRPNRDLVSQTTNYATSVAYAPRELEDFSQLLWQAVNQAHTLVSQIKLTTKSLLCQYNP